MTSPTRRLLDRSLVIVPCLLLLAGCWRRAAESPLRGRLTVAVSESHASLLTRQAALFHSLYPDAAVRVRAVSTREAFVALLADSVRAIVVDRPPNSEERQAMHERRLEISEVVLAEDALALLVPRANRLPSVTLEEAADLLFGRTRDWSRLAESGLSGPIALVMTGRNSGAWELVASHFFRDVPRPARLLATQRDVLQSVAADPNALGVVSVACWKDPNVASGPVAPSANAAGWASGVSGTSPESEVRPLSLTVVDSLGNPLQHALHQANIHLGLYPLHYTVRMIFDKRSLPAAGFSAFAASAPAQKLMLDAGLVPATMPVRLVQLH